MSPISEQVCGSCGYRVRGLTSFTCPECGSDLRDVGIVQSHRRGAKHVALALKIIAFIVIWLLIGALVAWVLAPVRVRIRIWTVFWAFALVAGVARIILAHLRPSRVSEISGSDRANRAEAAQPDAPVTRTISVMFIDVQGYTQLAAGATRHGLIELIRRVRQVVEPVIRHGRGRIVKTMGDGLLAVFDSATDAVLTGRDVQSAVTTLSPPVQLRIGVSTGEVALEREDVYGDAVNLAARLQQAAQAGEVYFAASTFHAMNRNEIPHERLEPIELKGLSERVEVFRVNRTS